MGTMRQRSTGNWELIVSTGRNPGTGRYGRVIRTVRTTSKREARAALSRLEVEVASGKVGIDDPTLAELFELWMAHLRTLGRSHATLYNYQRYNNREIIPVLGGMRLSKITARDLDALYTKLSDRGLVVAATGVPRSEACGIRWSDVDLETGRLTIERTYQVLPGVQGDRPPRPARRGTSPSTTTPSPLSEPAGWKPSASPMRSAARPRSAGAASCSPTIPWGQAPGDPMS